jgi:DNA polymerase III subunit delta'
LKEKDKDEPETDQQPGALHPRLRMDFQGHDDAESQLAQALTGDRLHHAWLLSGPKGLGKATLAYRFARAALGAKLAGPRPLDADPNDPMVRQIAAHAHPDLFILRRSVGDRGKARREITAEEARALPGFFALKPSYGGRRVAIVDCVDDLNRHAANALLKALEEPPSHTILILVAHAPGAALATIRSRCRRLRMHPLDPEAMAGAMKALSPEPVDAGVLELAQGRPGRALALQAAKAGPLRTQVRAALAALPRDRGKALSAVLLEKPGGNGRFELLIDIVQDWIAQAQRASHGGPPGGDPGLTAALADPDKASAWAQAWLELEALRHEADGLDMDETHASARICLILDRARGLRR